MIDKDTKKEEFDEDALKLKVKEALKNKTLHRSLGNRLGTRFGKVKNLKKSSLAK